MTALRGGTIGLDGCELPTRDRDRDDAMGADTLAKQIDNRSADAGSFSPALLVIMVVPSIGYLFSSPSYLREMCFPSDTTIELIAKGTCWM